MYVRMCIDSDKDRQTDSPSSGLSEADFMKPASDSAKITSWTELLGNENTPKKCSKFTSTLFLLLLLREPLPPAAPPPPRQIKEIMAS